MKLGSTVLRFSLDPDGQYLAVQMGSEQYNEGHTLASFLSEASEGYTPGCPPHPLRRLLPPTSFLSFVELMVRAGL